MRRIIPVLLLLAAFAAGASAQTSNVTATVTDADAQTWNNGTYTISYVQPPNDATAPVWNGTPMTPSQKLYTGSLNGSGVLTIALPDNAFITPAGSLWLFVICPNASAQCTQVSLKVTGASPDLSTLISNATITPRFSALLNAYGYLDVEVTPTPVPGGSYFNVTNAVTRVWSGSAWVNQGSGGGGGVTSITGTANQVAVSPTTGAAIASLPSTVIAPGSIAATTTVTGTQLISNVTAGTAPLSVASTTVVPNLNVSQLGGATFAAPGAIGGTTPSTGAFTTVAASGATGTTQPNITGTGAATVSGSPVPYWFINPGGGTQTWGSTGTMLGIDAPSGFGGFLLDFRIFNTGTSKFSLDANGTVASAGGYGLNGTTGAVTGKLFASSTNCSAVGTAASPSVVSCSAAPSGAFSCATNASGATCQVNTTAVTTNSNIQITSTASAGTRLSVTCNTTADVPTAPRIASISNGANFIINIGTVSVNPECYFYDIKN